MVARSTFAEALPVDLCEALAGIVIADGGLLSPDEPRVPRVVAFVYGEDAPHPPTLPFGRWRQAS